MSRKDDEYVTVSLLRTRKKFPVSSLQVAPKYMTGHSDGSPIDELVLTPCWRLRHLSCVCGHVGRADTGTELKVYR